MKRSLAVQISEVESEIDMRERVYPRLVGQGKMRQGEADYKTDTMRAVLATLLFLSENEAVIRRAIEDEKAATKSDGAAQ